VDAIVAGFGGQRAGAQRTRGLEFVDYRRYTPGDDLRSIDWNVYARLREVVVKAAPAEGHVDLALLLDGSRSMDDGTPSRIRVLNATVPDRPSAATEGPTRKFGGMEAAVALAPPVLPLFTVLKLYRASPWASLPKSCRRKGLRRNVRTVVRLSLLLALLTACVPKSATFD